MKSSGYSSREERIGISDIVIMKELPQEILADEKMHAC